MKVELYKGRVLLVEDNIELNDANSRALEICGYDVYSSLTLENARKFLSWLDPDVILLDVTLPDGNGFDFCKEIRDKTSAHILFLTAKTAHEDMVQGMSMGGDAYITKPFHPEEMLVKVEAAMRRHGTDKIQVIKKGSLTLDILARQAFDDGEPLRLTPIEFSLLLLLAQNEGQSLSASYIYETVWKALPIGSENALQTAISKLRRKIVNTGYSIVAKRYQGYVFEKN